MKILCFGSADFEDRSWVNAQQLMWRLAERHEILYVNSLGLRAPRAGRRDLGKLRRRLGAWLRRPSAPFPERRLTVIAPLSLPLSGSRAWRAISTRVLSAQLRAELRRLGFERPLIWTFLPSAADVIARLPSRAIIYHCVDAYEANPGVDAALVRAHEDRLLARAARVIASSPPLYERLAARHGAVSLMPNVVDTDLYPPPGTALPEPAALAGLPHPRLGYLGNLAAYKCDLELLRRAIRARPDFSWVLIGAVGRGEAGDAARELRRLPGTHWLGERSREELPALLHHLDAGLIPFASNETTRHSFPLKFLEYLACGLPVVCPPLASLTAHLRPPYAFSYATPEGFMDALAAALASRGAQPARERRSLAESHSWNSRIAELEVMMAPWRDHAAQGSHSGVSSS